MEQKYINYVGPSMNPLLWDGDGLHIVPYDNRAIRRGDVIVFVPPGVATKVVHRVVSVDEDGVRTRGDNGRQVDPWILSPKDILGRVTYVLRKDRRRNICGGFAGRITAGVFRCVHRGDAAISFLLHPVYRGLCRATFLRRRLHRLVKPRVLIFNRPEGVEQQLVVGRRLIGRRRPRRESWEIRRPYRLCVDEAMLPKYLPDAGRIKSEGYQCTETDT